MRRESMKVGIAALAVMTAVMCSRADDYALAEGVAETLSADATYGKMFVQGILTIAPGVTVNTSTFLMASNTTSTLVLGEGAKLNITAAAESNGQDALFGTRGGRAEVTLEKGAKVNITGQACFGYCVNATTPAYGTLTLGTNAVWHTSSILYFNRGTSIEMSGFTIDTVLSTVTLHEGAYMSGSQIIRNGTCALLMRFAGGYLNKVQVWSNQNGQTILESVDDADIIVKKDGSTLFLIGSNSTAYFTLRGTGNFVKKAAGTPPLFDLSATKSNGALNWQMDGDLHIEQGGFRILRDLNLGSSRIVCATNTTLDLDAAVTLRMAGIDSGAYGSLSFTNTVNNAVTGTLSVCGSGDLRAFPPNTKLVVESGATVRLAGPATTGYHHYRFLVTDGRGSTRNCIQLSELALLNGETDVTRAEGATYSSGNPNTSHATEHFRAAFDGDTTTKWVAGSGGASNSATTKSNVWIQVTYPSPQPITGYRWATANDKPRENETYDENCRDPKDWALLGSADGVNWVVLSEVRDYAFHKPRCAFTGDTFTPVFTAEMPVSSPRMTVEGGGRLVLAGTSLEGENFICAEDAASVTGKLHVASGTTTLRSETAWRYAYKYWRLSVTRLKSSSSSISNFTTNGAPQISEYDLYDVNGNRLNLGLTFVKNVAASSLSAGQFTVFRGANAVSEGTTEGPAKMFDGSTDTKFCLGGSVVSESAPLVITLRLADDAAAVAGYLFASANDHEERDYADWTLEASADGETWEVVDSRSGVKASSARKSYSSYNGGTPYAFSAGGSCDSAILAPGTLVQVDSGATLSLSAAHSPVSALAIDGAGAGTVDTLDVAADGSLYLTGVSPTALVDYTVPLTIGSLVNGDNLRSWTVYLDGEPVPNVRASARGTSVYICRGGTMIIFR